MVISQLIGQNQQHQRIQCVEEVIVWTLCSIAK